MVNHTIDGSSANLEIRIFQRRDEGYPVEMTLGGQQEFAGGHLAADILPWVPSGDLQMDGLRLSRRCLQTARCKGPASGRPH